MDHIDASAPKVYRVPDQNFGRLKQRIEELNRRAKRLGCDPIVITRQGVDDEVQPDGTVQRYHLLNVCGEAPRLDGWRFVAVIVPQPDCDENIVVALPGETVPVEYRSATMHCDHCHTTRRRNAVYVVRHDSGVTRQVGRTCLKDFTGHKSPQAIATWAEVLAELDDLLREFEREPGTRRARLWDLRAFLGITAYVMREDGGFVPRSQDSLLRTPTADAVLAILCDRQHAKPEPTAEDKERAEQALAWGETLIDRDDAELNDYLHNLRVVVASATVTWRTVGLAASLIATAERELGRARRAGLPQANEHFGTPGRRAEFTLTLHRVIDVFGRYGTSRLHKMTDAAGREAAWFASGAGAHDMEPGRTYRVRATVKRHEYYRGTAQTVLTRVTVLEEARNAA